MKLTVKTLQGVAFPLEAEPTDTVAAVKAKIQELQSFAVDQQKLIHAGKVLKDDSPLSEYGVKENDFLVVMVTKPKTTRPAAAPAAPAPAPAPTPAPAPAAPAPVAAPAPSTSAASSSSASTPAAVTTPSSAPSSTATASSSTPAVAAGGVAVGEEVNATVQQLCDMGFPEDQVRAALRAAFNNADRAVEYLMNGIPEQASAPAPAPSAAAPAGGAVGMSSIEALRQHPQIDALRQLVQSNPAALPSILQQIGSQNPELLRLITQNQAEFVRMLNEPIGTGSSGADASAAGAADMGFGEAAAMGGGFPSGQQIQQLLDSLTPEQQAQMAAQMGHDP
ncbi:hypothetical protein PINS_up023561 [Pythium insidiosum]|nr:hypothetical protein PINS_up023561 [Pythium insidiosum]